MRKWLTAKRIPGWDIGGIGLSVCIFVMGCTALHFAISDASAQERSIFGSLRSVHMRIAKGDTETYVRAVYETIQKTTLLKDQSAKDQFIAELQINLGIQDLVNESLPEELRKIKARIYSGDWTEESKVAAYESVKQLLEEKEVVLPVE